MNTNSLPIHDADWGEGVSLTALDQPMADWKPLYLLNIYRLIIIIVFLTSFMADVAPSFLGRYDGRLFLVTGWFYFGFALFCIISIRYQRPPFQIQVLVQVLGDIVAIMLLMHASGGIESGMGMLLVVVIAGGSLLTPGRTALFFAAIASLAVLFHVSLADIYFWFSNTSYTHAGMLGIAFFSTAFLSFFLARRTRASELLAQQRGVRIQYLAQLNEQIVQHIQSGIIVVDVIGRIRLFNEAARRLLGLNETPYGRTLSAICPQLAVMVDKWQHRQKFESLLRPSAGESELISTFTELKHEGSTSVLIVLEDATLTTQRAQQLKLASLGRLTASIAHEIRNPLAAISQASQLLAESEHLSNTETRLSQIIIDHTQRMNTIIENVLQISRRQTANTQRLNLHDWLQHFIAEFIEYKALPEQAITLHYYAQPLWVDFDPSQLYQVVSNLCENGLRYSLSQHSHPLLRLSTHLTQETERPYLAIQDYGGGMTADIMAQIFEPFFTTESRGSGLGLYIAKELCDANKATLHLWQNTMQGCCFRIHFTDATTGYL